MGLRNLKSCHFPRKGRKTNNKNNNIEGKGVRNRYE
jgi:hypothetical protein